MGGYGELIAIVGLGNLISFAQTARHMAINKAASLLSIAMIPAFVLIMAAIWIAVGWWSIAVFIAASLIAGFGNAVTAKTFGIEFLYRTQPYTGSMFALCSVACWFV